MRDLEDDQQDTLEEQDDDEEEVEGDDDAPLPDEDLTEFEGESDEEEDEDIEKVVQLSQKEQNAKSLAIRRAIEQRREQQELDHEVDYLDLGSDE